MNNTKLMNATKKVAVSYGVESYILKRGGGFDLMKSVVKEGAKEFFIIDMLRPYVNSGMNISYLDEILLGSLSGLISEYGYSFLTKGDAKGVDLMKELQSSAVIEGSSQVIKMAMNPKK